MALHLAHFRREGLRGVVLLAAAVFGQPVRGQQQDVAGAHDPPLVHLVVFLEAERTGLGHIPVDGVERGQHAQGRKRNPLVRADLHETVVAVGEDQRQRVGGRQKAEAGVRRDLAVDQRQEFVRARRLIETAVQILEEVARDLAVHVELVEGADQERLVQHGREQRVGHPVSGDIDDGDPGPMLASTQVLGDIRPS